MHHALNPDPYRGVFGDDAAAYANDVNDLISAATPGRVAGFFHETIQGVGGAVPLADGYLPLVYEVRRGPFPSEKSRDSLMRKQAARPAGQ